MKPRAWAAMLPASVTADLAYIRAWPKKQRPVAAEIAGELAFFGAQAPLRRSVFSYISRPSGELEASADGWIAPEVRRRQLLHAAATGGELTEESGVPTLPEEPALRKELQSVLAEREWALIPSGRHDFRSTAKRDPRVRAVAPVSSRLGRISEFGAGYTLCFNSGYYVWLEEEFADGYARTGDPIGLEVVDGVVTSPPLVSRSAVLRVMDQEGHQRLALRRIDVSNITVSLPGGVLVHGEAAGCSCPRRGDCARAGENAKFVTRQRGADAVVAVPTGAVAFTLYGAQVCQVSFDAADCPSNGLVIILSGALASKALDGCKVSASVSYDLAFNGERVLSGSQVGPAMLRDGATVDVAAEIEAALEVYEPSRMPPIALTGTKSSPRGADARQSG